MFESILNISSGSITMSNAIVCTLCSLVLGLIVACVYMFRTQCSKNFAVTLALLPVIVQMVIMMVNGNLGTGVAVLGAFSLVRFRSVPGTSREICSLFFAMSLGIATGMGFVTFAVMATAVIGGTMILLSATGFGERKSSFKELKVTIPEDLDYTGIFDDLFDKYTHRASLEMVKTTNMGSLYELRYHIVMRDPLQEKAFLDEIRCRNGNLTVSCGRLATNGDSL